ncbi:MAG: hypothetical protein QW764_04330 [Desulfurococcaceae archaeon]
MTTEQLKCPKDGNPLVLIYESEKLSNGLTRVTMYYKCSTCNYRRDLERLEIGVLKDNGAISIKRVLLYS